MARNVKRWLGPDGLLPVLRDRIVDKGIVGRDYCYPVDENESPVPPPADRFVEILAGDQIVDQGIGWGASPPTVAGVNSVWEITLFTRLWLDQDNRATSLLLDTQHGLYVWTRPLIAALHHYDPVDTDGNEWFQEPMRLLKVGFRARRPKPGWASAVTTWELKYLADFATQLP